MKSENHSLTPEEAEEFMKSYHSGTKSLIQEEKKLEETLETAPVIEWNPVVMAGKSIPGPCFCTLFSGSSGNCLFVGDSADGGILIDIGRSCRQVEKQLSGIGVMPEQIQGILLTHEHTDHCKGLEQWEKKYTTPLYSAEETLEELDNQGKISGKFPAYAVFDEEFAIGDYRVTAFPLSHDCAQCMGYRVTLPSGHSVSIVPDTGKITEECLNVVPGSDLVCCENDYNTDKLWCGEYPTQLKERIDSDTGHLSTKQVGAFARKLVSGDRPTETIVLYHLSEHNNDPELAKELVKSAVHDKALVETAKKDKVMVFPLRQRTGPIREQVRVKDNLEWSEEELQKQESDRKAVEEEKRKEKERMEEARSRNRQEEERIRKQRKKQEEEEEVSQKNINWWLTPQEENDLESVPKKPRVLEEEPQKESKSKPTPKRKGPTLSR